MAEDGVTMGRPELEWAAPVLSFGDRGIGERNIATLLRIDSGSNEESLGCFDIVDEMEVEKEGEALLVYGVALELHPQTKVMCLHYANRP